MRERDCMLTERELDILRRRARGESQQQIARDLGISQAAISKSETNSHQKILEAERYLKLLETLGVTIDDAIAGRKVTYKAKPRKRRGDA